MSSPTTASPARTPSGPLGVLTPHSQVTLSRMDRSTIAPLVGNFT